MPFKSIEDKSNWRPSGRFSLDIKNPTELNRFVESAVVPIHIGTLSYVEPVIKMSGVQNRRFSLWEYNSINGCVNVPKQNIDLIAIHFVTSGHIDFQCRGNNATGSPDVAILVDFKNMRDFLASERMGSFGGSFETQALIETNTVLTGQECTELPPFSITADMRRPGLKALFATMRQVHGQIQAMDLLDDLTFLMIQEIVGYQLLSSWPVRPGSKFAAHHVVRPDRLQLAKDFIEENLALPLTLASVAAAAGLSVRMLQETFRREICQTPFQYIINQRLARVHQDLIGSHNQDLSIKDLANKWGFTHMSDFGQRYRSLYGCTPTETRRTFGGIEIG